MLNVLLGYLVTPDPWDVPLCQRSRPWIAASEERVLTLSKQMEGSSMILRELCDAITTNDSGN